MEPINYRLFFFVCVSFFAAVIFIVVGKEISSLEVELKIPSLVGTKIKMWTLSESEHIFFRSRILLVYIFQVLSGETVGINYY